MESTSHVYAYHICTKFDISGYLKPDDLKYEDDDDQRQSHIVRRGTGIEPDAFSESTVSEEQFGRGRSPNHGNATINIDTGADEGDAIEETEEIRIEETGARINEPTDEIACSQFKRRKIRSCNKRRTPWKVISYHHGTRHNHYHLVYLSTTKSWASNSKLGKIIKKSSPMCRKITCLTHLLEYLAPSPTRKTLRNILTEEDKRSVQCAACQLGIPPRKGGSIEIEPNDAEGRNTIFREQSTAQSETIGGMGESSDATDEDISHTGERGSMVGQQGNTSITIQSTHTRDGRNFAERRSAYLNEQNGKLVMLLCNNRAFNEGDAQKFLCQTPEGITMQFAKNFNERLKTAISISRILVFCETIDQRIDRAKSLYLRMRPNANEQQEIEDSFCKLKSLLQMNNLIYLKTFAKITKDHLYRRSNKKNNLFFVGPPSCGKTMVMESLVSLHYNFERLTGLTPGSSFNFSSLIHANACFMDECKLTENQFEQWKLLAAGQPMCTDIKYKQRHNITDCVLYTASNYAISAYVQVPDAEEAIETRTHTFKFNNTPVDYFHISPWTWEKFWDTYYKDEENDLD